MKQKPSNCMKQESTGVRVSGADFLMTVLLFPWAALVSATCFLGDSVYSAKAGYFPLSFLDPIIQRIDISR